MGNKISDFQKNIIGWVGIAITFISSFVALNSKVSANELKINTVEKRMDKIEENNINIPKLIHEQHIEILKELNEIKLQLKDKEDRR